jgi:Fe-S-cluster containining protein
MNCRTRCGACCIAPSISSPIPGMAGGKPAGVRCVQLREDLSCALFGLPERPRVCGSLAAQPSMCGDSRDEALAILAQLELDTLPGVIVAVSRVTP